jgi:hypothetical protein
MQKSQNRLIILKLMLSLLPEKRVRAGWKEGPAGGSSVLQWPFQFEAARGPDSPSCSPLPPPTVLPQCLGVIHHGCLTRHDRFVSWRRNQATLGGGTAIRRSPGQPPCVSTSFLSLLFITSFFPSLFLPVVPTSNCLITSYHFLSRFHPHLLLIFVSTCLRTYHSTY